MTDPFLVSVILPSARPYQQARTTVDSILMSASHYRDPVELILIRDTSLSDCAEPWPTSTGSVRILLIHTGGRIGSARCRYAGIAASSGPVLLFTDDDVLVPTDWIGHMVIAAQQHGTCTTPIRSRGDSFWERCDERIDHYRVHATDSAERVKFMSFPSFAIRRDLLPEQPFDNSSRNLADDVDFACNLRLSGIKLHVDSTIVVLARYPATYGAFVRRKIRHGLGVGRLRARLGHTRWQELEMGSTLTLIRRWVNLSGALTHRQPIRRLMTLAANLAYCVALIIGHGVDTVHPRTRW